MGDPISFGRRNGAQGWGTAVDSYVVHIFRRPGQSGEGLVGLVERIGNGERKAFQSEAQLLEYLLTERSARKEKPARRNAPKQA